MNEWMNEWMNECEWMDEWMNELIDRKTVRIFEYSTTREQWNKRSGKRLKTESETGETR